MITLASLIAAGITPSLARIFEAPLNATCLLFGIDTPMREAAFVAQCGHESDGFARLEESMWYRHAESIRANWPGRVTSLAEAEHLVGRPEALANIVYAGRGGNGDVASGDGWTYRGRGLIQLTFRGAYARCGAALGRPYEAQPTLLAEPEHAARSAGWYWHDNHLNALADTGQVESVTHVINPKLLGLDDRKRRYAMAMEAFA